jgi:hypothetical protein
MKLQKQTNCGDLEDILNAFMDCFFFEMKSPKLISYFNRDVVEAAQTLPYYGILPTIVTR